MPRRCGALGKSVTAAAGSDVAELLRFLDHAASDTAWLAKQIERVRSDVAAMQSSLEGDPLEFGGLKSADALVLAGDIQRHLFGGTGDCNCICCRTTRSACTIRAR